MLPVVQKVESHVIIVFLSVDSLIAGTLPHGSVAGLLQGLELFKALKGLFIFTLMFV